MRCRALKCFQVTQRWCANLRDSIRLVIALTANKASSVLFSAKTLLPGLVLGAGLPAWIVGWIVPIRESLSLLPQAFLSVYLRRNPARYRVWRMGMCIQAFSGAGILSLCWSFANSDMGIDSDIFAFAFLFLLAIFSVGRSCCSLTWKDIQADTVDKGKRGDLIGNATTLAGIVTIGVALPLALFPSTQSMSALLLLGALSILMLGITLLLMWPIKTTIDVDQSDTSASEGTLWQRLTPSLSAAARKLIIVRCLFVHTALVAPFFVLSQSQTNDKLAVYYLAAEALAALVSAKFWGYFADSSARFVLVIAGVLAILACLGVVFLQPTTLIPSVLMFFALSISHTGVRTGRKTYTLDIDEGQSRTELVGSANTIVGIVLLVIGGLYAALQSILGATVISIMTAMLVVGVVLALRLPSEK